uniref:Uncharacterized protein MANES_09G142600 n=1 Tax=Rhizophora mucronata TaxID=61149 RepID=A0A2P2JWN6_RHIMU
MDFCLNVTVPGEFPHQQEQLLDSPPPCSKLGAALTASTSPLDDLLSAQNMEVDVSLEWLSVFVEDCLTSTGNCLPVPTTNCVDQKTCKTPKPPKSLQQKPKQNSSALQSFVIPSKARSKRKRVTSLKTRNPLSSWTCSSQNVSFASSDPPLLQQAYWLADSELIVPKKEDSSHNDRKGSRKETRDSAVQVKTKMGVEVEVDQEKLMVAGGIDSLSTLESSNDQQPRRCTHCLAQKTPQWRAGPLGPKTLCNACGVRYKSGRLLPEYRPAKSPTFVSHLHSNSHKKVLEMRMATSDK